MNDWIPDFWRYFLNALQTCVDKRAARIVILAFKAEMKLRWVPAQTDIENLGRLLFEVQPVARHRRLVQTFYLRDFRVRYVIPPRYLHSHTKCELAQGMLRSIFRFAPESTVNQKLSLVDPVTKNRLRLPIRYADCTHVDCFEGDVTKLPDSCPICSKIASTATIDTTVVAILAKSSHRAQEAHVYPDITVKFPQEDASGADILELFRRKTWHIDLSTINSHLFATNHIADYANAYREISREEYLQNPDVFSFS